MSSHNVIDIIIILLFLIGIVSGIKNGVVKGTISLIGTIVVFVLAFYLKNPLASFFFEHLPFLSIFKGADIINIMFYELIAFLIMISLLSIILGILIKISKIIERLFNFTVILGVISKLLGAIIGFAETYLIVFALIVIVSQPFMIGNEIYKSKLASLIANKSFILTNISKKSINTFNEVYDLKNKYKSDNVRFNYEALDVMMKYDFITVDSVIKLKEKDKLKIKGIDNLIKKYEDKK